MKGCSVDATRILNLFFKGVDRGVTGLLYSLFMSVKGDLCGCFNMFEGASTSNITHHTHI